MVIALRAKDKLGFITGKSEMPNPESPHYDNWLRVDSMVISWILNSITKEIVEAFLYTNSSKELWEEQGQRFGESDDPLLYQIKREISGFCQGNMTVMVYYTKLKKMWDEVACLRQIPVCTCGAAKSLIELDNEDNLIQFLMGLNECYDHVKNQILLMDPFPSVNKAYSMVLRVEKQREVNNFVVESSENTTAMLSMGNAKYEKFNDKESRFAIKKKESGKKDDRYCSHCRTAGHNRETCFKLHGYPEWYQGFKQQKYKPLVNSASHMEDTPLDFISSNNKGEFGSWNESISYMIQQEVKKAMKGKSVQNSNEDVSIANTVNFAGFAD